MSVIVALAYLSLESNLIRFCTVTQFVFVFQKQYFMVKLHCLNFRMITIIFFLSNFFYVYAKSFKFALHKHFMSVMQSAVSVWLVRMQD